MNNNEIRTIVVSAVNLRKGGTLTILQQCLNYLSSLPIQGYRVIALVHRRALADFPNVEYIELPWSIESWSKRLWCEYVTMGRIARQIGDIDLWLSLHDTTPRVKARCQAVYCQTSFPFFDWHVGDFRFDPKIPLFGIFTRFAYRIGIRRNRFLIVQQQWLREGFSRMFGLPQDQFIVAPATRTMEIPKFEPITKDHRFTFLYASTPDSHKNFETLCQATLLLEQSIGIGRFRTIITVRGDENKYARWLHAHWGHVSSLTFAGLMDRSTLYAHYALSDCLVFPSRIETWGLPISEYMGLRGDNGQLLLADLPYAHETSAGATQVAFFPPTDATALTGMMQRAFERDASLMAPNPTTCPPAPYAESWETLFQMLIKEV